MVEAAGHAGYDFVLLDMEHGTTTFQELPNLIRAANVTGVCPVVRRTPAAAISGSIRLWMSAQARS